MAKKKRVALSKVELNVIIGRHLVAPLTQAEAKRLIDHISLIEELLDEADNDDVFGTEGWRHRLGIDD